MLLLVHIVVALASIGFASYMLLAPTRGKLPVSYTLIGMTLVSGIGLVVVNPAHMLHACLSGITYTIIVTALTAVTQVRLKRAQTTEEHVTL